LWSALAVFFTGGLAHVLAWPSGRIAGILRWRPLVHVGKISYGLYLYHFPVFLLVNNGMAAGVLPDLPRPAHVALKLVLTYAVALASFRWIESRFLALKDRFI
jgi:peptidoglycan/LPS O-acetylase OafA/YrhL